MSRAPRVSVPVAATTLALGIGLFLGPVLLPSVTLAEGDLLVFFPYLYQLPWEGVWSPWTSLGAPYLANPQTGFFYPPAWLLAWDYQAFLGPYLFLHLWFGGLGAFLWCRRVSGTSEGALIGALAYALGGPALSLLTKLDKLPGYAFLPWILLGLAMVLHVRRASSPRERAWGVGVAAAATALTLLGGSVEGVAIAGGVGVLSAAFGSGRVVGRLGWTALVLGLGLGLAGMLWVPFLHILPETARVGGLAAAKGLSRSTHPQDLWGWITHTPFWDLAQGRYLTLTSDGAQRTTFLLSLYGGLPALLMALVGAFGAWREGAVRVAFVGCLAFGAMALGQYNPLYAWAYDALPGLSAVRYPEKWWLGTLPFQGLLMAYGWAWLRGHPRGRIGLLVVGVLLGSLTFALRGAGWGDGSLPGAVLAQGLVPCLALLGVSGVMVLGSRGHLSQGVVFAAALSLMGADYLVGGKRLYRRTPTEQTTDPLGTQLALAAQAQGVPPRLWTEDPRPGIALPSVPPGAPFNAMIQEIAYPNTAIGAGVPYVYGMNPLRLAPVQSLVAYGVTATLETRLRLLRRVGAGLWIIWNQSKALDMAQAHGLQPLPGVETAPLKVGFLRDPKAVERLRWVDTLTWVAHPQGALEALGGEIPPGTAIVTRGDPGTEALAQAKLLAGGEVRLGFDSPMAGAWVVEYVSEGPGMLLLGEAFSKGWHYRVDGGEAKGVAQVDVALIGVPAPGGRHRVEVIYRPPGLRLGLAVSFLSLLGVMGIVGRFGGQAGEA